jgi:hypothetical protein
MTVRSGKCPPELRCYWMKASSQPSDSRNGNLRPPRRNHIRNRLDGHPQPVNWTCDTPETTYLAAD